MKYFFHKGARCGYGLRPAFAKGTDPAYGAAINVMSACQGVTGRRLLGNWPNYSACIPVLVVDSPLYEFELLPDGDFKLTEVESSQFLFSAHFLKSHVVCLVRVVTAPHLDKTATWAKSLVDALRKDLEPDQEKFFAEATKAAQQRDN